MRARAVLETRPAPGVTFYAGTVDVDVDDDADADAVFRAAVRRLRRTSFPDRGADAWRLVGWQRVTS